MVTLNPTDRIHAAAVRNAQDDVPDDGPTRPLIRLGVILVGAYDQPDGVDADVDYDPEQPIADLLTDVLHWCDNEGVDIDQAMMRAVYMRDLERQEWGLEDA